jgi:UPF0176 protein
MVGTGRTQKGVRSGQNPLSHHAAIRLVPYEILLYYLYTTIDDPEAYVGEHRQLCEELELLGRILVAREGINGTVSGLKKHTTRYREILRSRAETATIEFKIDPAASHAFKKLAIKARTEIVTLGLPPDEDIDPKQLTGRYLSPREFFEAMQDPEVVLLDGRNDYESELGHFRNAICPDVEHFREFPEWIRKNLAHLKDKPILTYCTGGIRCEKLSGFLIKEGFGNVSQLKGGIVTYGRDEDVGGRDFEGSCYVFDQRIKVAVNHANPRMITCCVYCDTECDRYINCSYPPCNDQFCCCEPCEAKHGRYCRPGRHRKARNAQTL